MILESTGGEVTGYHSGLQESFEAGDSISERPGKNHRENDGGHTDSDTGSPLLQESTAAQEFGLPKHTELRVTDSLRQQCKGGATMVDVASVMGRQSFRHFQT